MYNFNLSAIFNLQINIAYYHSAEIYPAIVMKLSGHNKTATFA